MDHGPPVNWDDIAGLEFAKSVIKEIVVWPMLRPYVLKQLKYADTNGSLKERDVHCVVYDVGLLDVLYEDCSPPDIVFKIKSKKIARFVSLFSF